MALGWDRGDWQYTRVNSPLLLSIQWILVFSLRTLEEWIFILQKTKNSKLLLAASCLGGIDHNWLFH